MFVVLWLTVPVHMDSVVIGVVGVFPDTKRCNETVRRTLVSGGVPSVLELVGVIREDVKRPDGIDLLWDINGPELCQLLV